MNPDPEDGFSLELDDRSSYSSPSQMTGSLVEGLFLDKASLSPLLNLSVLRPTLLPHVWCNVGSQICDLCVHSVRVINKVVYFVENCNDTCCSYKACVLRVCYIMHAYVWVFDTLVVIWLAVFHTPSGP